MNIKRCKHHARYKHPNQYKEPVYCNKNCQTPTQCPILNSKIYLLELRHLYGLKDLFLEDIKNESYYKKDDTDESLRVAYHGYDRVIKNIRELNNTIGR